jgi:hypothetical protein
MYPFLWFSEISIEDRSFYVLSMVQPEILNVGEVIHSEDFDLGTKFLEQASWTHISGRKPIYLQMEFWGRVDFWVLRFTLPSQRLRGKDRRMVCQPPLGAIGEFIIAFLQNRQVDNAFSY